MATAALRRACVLLAASLAVAHHLGSADAGALRALQATNSTAVDDDADESWRDPVTWLVVSVFGLRLSDFLLGAIRRRLCPKEKVVVMSCPEMGTLRPDGRPPYDQPVMDKVAAVSYTHLPSPRDATLSRMPSSA